MFIEVKDLCKGYQTGEVMFQALNKVSFSMERGQIAVILGPSGSGKSTLLNILGGIDSADSGNVIVNNENIVKYNDKKLIEYRRKSVGFIFQFYNLVPNLTAYENVEVAANICSNPIEINEILKAVGIYELKDRFPRELSGGQQQRLSIARALVKRPDLLFCDEPTGALDYASSKEILKLLEKVNKDFGTTIFIITHNNAIAGMAHRIIRLRSGNIIENVKNEQSLEAERVEW